MTFPIFLGHDYYIQRTIDEAMIEARIQAYLFYLDAMERSDWLWG